MYKLSSCPNYMVRFRRMAKLRNAIAISLLLRRGLTSTVTDLSSAARLLHPKHLSRTFSVSSNDYLVSSLSLSPDSVKRKPISIKSTSNADSVITLFTDYSFSHTHLARIFSFCPMLLTFNPHNNLKPKLDFRSSPIFPRTRLLTSKHCGLAASLTPALSGCFFSAEALNCLLAIQSISVEISRRLWIWVLTFRAACFPMCFVCTVV